MDISYLADSDLAEIFQRLPPFERLIISQVCHRWYSANPSLWVDITQIDLTPIPCANIGAIVKRSPNVQSVFAAKKNFEAKALFSLCQAPRLSRVKLYDCNIQIRETLASRPDLQDVALFSKIFSGDYEHTAWSEFGLQNVRIGDTLTLGKTFKQKWYMVPLPRSLTHLQLGHLRADSGEGFILTLLERLQNLQCLILSQPANDDYLPFWHGYFLGRIIENLQLLRELYIEPVADLWSGTQLSEFVASMPHLEVLFLKDIRWAATLALAAVITGPSALRILVITGAFGAIAPIVIPARMPFPNGFGQVALGQLNVCLGPEAAVKMRFVDSPLVAKYRIVQPMSAFLEREDIKQLFEGVWIAAKIKESARYGGNLCISEVHEETSPPRRQLPNRFRKNCGKCLR